MIFSNHSCDPTIGIRGQIVFVALRQIAAGEELTHDWATTDDDDYAMTCRCGATACRAVIPGKIGGTKICSGSITAGSPGTFSKKSMLPPATPETALWHYSECMFFRREKPHEFTFTERIDGLRKLGFSTSPAGPGKAQIIRDGIGAIIEDRPAQHPRVNKAGLVLGDEIGLLVNRGFQMFWKSPSGRTAPALATHLKALHAFEEDLKEGLGLTSLYNESLGTTSDLHLYDRVQHRDQGDADKPWEHKAVTS